MSRLKNYLKDKDSALHFIGMCLLLLLLFVLIAIIQTYT